MIRAAIAGLLLLLAGACGSADRAPAPPPARPALWAIVDREGAVDGWLFGTIHALPDGWDWRTSALDQAIRDAGVLVVEVRDLDPERTRAVFQQLARDEPVPPLAARVPPAARSRYEALLARTPAPGTSLDTLETWAAALVLARMTATASPTNGVDVAVIEQFAGRPVVELEGAASQLAIFDALPEREQRALLAAVVTEQSDPEADAFALAGDWLAGDLAALERTTRRGLLADPALYRALSTERNAAWADRLLPLLAAGQRPLVAVGAAHMLGSEGLPALLERRGYTVRRIQ